MTRLAPASDPLTPTYLLAGRSRLLRLLTCTLPACFGALALLAPGAGAAVGPSETAGASTTPVETQTSAALPTSTSSEEAQDQSGAPVSTTTTTTGTTTAPATTVTPSAETETPSSTVAPEVQTQTPQAESAPSAAVSPHHRVHRSNHPPTTPSSGGGSAKGSTKTAPLPSALTPPFPTSLGAPISGIPNFFIESFRIPPFLLPIYQAAGTAYGIPWQVLAAINEVETDYGRDLSLSSAGAEGWMQFLPSSWARYGVDANGDGFEDPYNPADAIFAAARYLAAAGGAGNIRAAIYSYNHSQAYVDSVMLRAQLLGGTPPELLAAITGLTESRFPVHAPSRFADGFPPAPGALGGTLVGTTIYAAAGAPVIAVQDGQITSIGESPSLGHYISLRDAYGNTYTYAQLGSVADLYPVLEPRYHTAVSPRIAKPGVGAGPRPSGPASAGVQPHSPLSEAAISSGLAMGAAAPLEAPPAPSPPTPPPTLPPSSATPSTPRVFRAGADEVYLHDLRPGVEVLAGTVLGHLGVAGETEGVGATSVPGQTEAHMLFQIRPAGAGAPLIDPKPILDGWVQLENTSIFRAKGENPFLATSPTVGQVLLESKPQLEQQVVRDPGVRFTSRCGRGKVQAGQVDRRVLAALEFLSVSGLRPTVSSLGCAHAAGGAGAGNAADGPMGDAIEISAIDGTPIAGHEAPGSLADIAVRRLLRLQGTMKPRQIATGSLSYPGTANTVALPADRGVIHVGFEPVGGARASRAAAAATPLSPRQWLQLISRLGEIPDPTVAGKPSAAAIPDSSTAGSSSAGVAPTGNGVPTGAGGG
jgi:transglycosylase-like protein with SLT domain